MLNRQGSHRSSVLIAALVIAGSTSSPQAGDHFGHHLPRCGFLPDKACVTTGRPATEEKSCWEVECTEVCIPAVRFPWECRKGDGCSDCVSTLLPKCGRVRCVRKLKKGSYECDTCKYEHTIVNCCPGDCRNGRCRDCLPDSGDDCIPSANWPSTTPAETLPLPPTEPESVEPPDTDPTPTPAVQRPFGRSAWQSLKARFPVRQASAEKPATP